MGMMRLAVLNFRNGFRNYLSLVISLAFAVVILFNFQNIIYSGAFEVLGTRNKEYVEILVQMISFVLGCFMFFFIWYSTNVFLTGQKKRMGIYVFMGLSNDKIGEMYLMETTLMGLSALVAGLVLGALNAGLFQMILLAISDITVDIQFEPAPESVWITAAVYGVIYMIFVIKGYLSVVGSSVLNMISASRQNEDTGQNRLILVMKSLAGGGVLGLGYWLAVKKTEGGALRNAFGAVILVIAGVYLLFGGLIPAVFRILAADKRFLYGKQRILWVNSIIFRIKKNYRTYAMVSVLMLCSVTALATSFAMKGRYDTIIQFENTYTFQILERRGDLGEEAGKIIGEDNELGACSGVSILCLNSALINMGHYTYDRYALLSYSQLKNLAENTGMELAFEEPADDEVIKISHPYLMSLITDVTGVEVTIGEKTYHQAGNTTVPYLGYLQEQISFYMVSDREYEKLRPLGEELYTWNYRMENPENFAGTKERLREWMASLNRDDTALVSMDPGSNELDWIKVFYSICMFMFLVFVLASGSMMYMKIYNDAFEEKERYQVMMKMGFDRKILMKSVKTELAVAYGLPFGIMGVSSFFSVKALANMMSVNLLGVNLASVGVVLLILAAWYGWSVRAYGRNAGLLY